MNSAISRCSRFRSGLLLLLSLVPLAAIARGEDASAIERRIAESAKFLSSDEARRPRHRHQRARSGRRVPGRPVQRNGAQDHALRRRGLSEVQNDRVGSKLGPQNSLTLVGPAKEASAEPQRVALKLNESFSPLALGGRGSSICRWSSWATASQPKTKSTTITPAST